MTREALVDRIQRLARNGGLFRIDHRDPVLYARARRHFGSWAAAVAAAGFDYRGVLREARRRSVQGRIRLRRRPIDRQHPTSDAAAER